MKEISIDILDLVSEDRDIEHLPNFEQDDYLVNDLLDNLLEAMPLVLNILKSKGDDLEEDYSVAYRKCYFCLGMSEILNCKKLIHLLRILEFIVDYGRIKKDFSKYSMIYVTELIFKTSEKILKDLAKTGSTSIDTSDIILECDSYIRLPLEAHIQESNSAQNEYLDNDNLLKPKRESNYEINGDNSEIPEDLKNNVSSDNLKIIDEVEYLNFSSEKLELVNDFCDEAFDNLQKVELALVEVEESPDQRDKINEIFRYIHTVKGGSKLLEVKKIEILAHEMETLLDDLRTAKLGCSEEIIDTLIEGNIALIEMVSFVRDMKPLANSLDYLVNKLVLVREKNLVSRKPNMQTSLKKEVNQVKISDNSSIDNKYRESIAEENIRVPASKLDDVLNTASEVFINRIRLQNDTEALSGSLYFLEKLIRSSRLERISDDVKLIGEKIVDLELEIISQNLDLDIRRSKSGRIVKQIREIIKTDLFVNLEKIPEDIRLSLRRVEEFKKQLQQNVDDLEGLSGRLQTGAMGFRMVPIGNLLNRFPAQVRDLSRKLGKKAKLTILGADTELDKVLINQLADPLLHIVRNSLDHGLESLEKRKALGKAEVGEIKISAYYHGSNAGIEIVDDGAGINKPALIKKALKSKLIADEDVENLSEKEIFDLLFEPGLSTASQVTELSGRGVGMDVVKTAISSIQGNIQIESEENFGTKVTVQLPLTLAIVGVLLVSENGHNFAFPVLNVVEVLSIESGSLKQVGDSLVFNYRGKTLNVNALSKFLDFPPSIFDQEELLIIVLSDGEQNLGVIVDEIKGQQEVLIKQFGSLLSSIEYVMGCTILSDSSLILILNVWELITHGSDTPLRLENQESGRKNRRSLRSVHTVLVVDDSSLQRKRLTNMLKRVGYSVEAAVDGHDALQKLKTNDFSVLCVDIVMPLMDGYEFIEKIQTADSVIDPVIFLITGKKITEGAERRRLDALKVAGLFYKPINEEEIINAIDKACLNSAM